VVQCRSSNSNTWAYRAGAGSGADISPTFHLPRTIFMMTFFEKKLAHPTNVLTTFFNRLAFLKKTIH